MLDLEAGSAAIGLGKAPLNERSEAFEHCGHEFAVAQRVKDPAPEVALRRRDVGLVEVGRKERQPRPGIARADTTGFGKCRIAVIRRQVLAKFRIEAVRENVRNIDMREWVVADLGVGDLVDQMELNV